MREMRRELSVASIRQPLLPPTLALAALAISCLRAAVASAVTCTSSTAFGGARPTDGVALAAGADFVAVLRDRAAMGRRARERTMVESVRARRSR